MGQIVNNGDTGLQARTKINQQINRWFNVETYGAVGDGQVVYDAAINSSSQTLTCATSTPFSASDVGKSIKIAGAGAAGIALVTTIASFVSPSQVTVTNAASTTVSNKQVVWGTDNTSAIQAALDACVVNAVTGGGTVYLPRGIYVVAGALITTKNTATTNAQIIIPPMPRGDGEQQPRLELVGEVGNTPIPLRNELVQTTGTILWSFISASGTRAAVIGSGAISGNPFAFNYVFCHIKNITTLVNCNDGASAPSMGCVDFSELDWSSATDCSFSIDSEVLNSTNATGSSSFGLIMGRENDSAQNIVTRCTASGLEYPFVFGEHVLCEMLLSTANVNAITLVAGSFNIMGKVILSQCINYIYVPTSAILGMPSATSTVSVVNLDVTTDGGVSSGKWYQPSKDIIDVNNRLWGQLVWNSGGPAGNLLGNTGATNVNIRRIRSFLPSQNNQAGGAITGAGADITVGNTRNFPVTELGTDRSAAGDEYYPHLHLSTQQTATANIVGSFAAVNKNLGTAEKRLYRELYKTNGATNTGMREEYVMAAGTLTKVADLTDARQKSYVPFELPSFTVSGLPSASVGGRLIFVSDETGGPVVAYSDGTNWRRVSDGAIVS